ncbi:MAG: ABC transporter ATP-binding protein/permease [Lachnospiraceae bacterium]|nr:ABC transporter ATP-binding protein/permease [Lachnospiraceae bacterium]
MRKAKGHIKKLNRLLTTAQKTLGVFVLLFSIFAAVFELLGVSVIVPLINVLVDPRELLSNKYIAMIIPSAIDATNLSEENRKLLVITVIIGTIIIYLVKNAFFIFNTWLKNKYAFKIQREMSVAMMQKYIRNGYQFFLNHNYSELRQGMDGDVRALYYIVSGILQITTQILIVALIGIYMLVADWKLAIGAILTGAVCLLFVMGIFRRRMSESGRLLRELSIKAEKTMEETLHGIKLVLIAHKERFFIDKYNEEVTKRNKVDVVKTAGSEYPMYIIEAISITGIMISLCVRVLSLEDPTAYVAVLGSFAVGMFRILPAIGKISSTANAIVASIPSLDSIYHNMCEQEDESINAQLTDRDCSDFVFSNCIEVKELTFGYSGSDNTVLQGIDLTIKKSTSVGVIGESGAGKSTLADILLGLLKPSTGKVTIDGIELEELARNGWNGIGYVPQTIFLTDSTIAENVAYGIAEQEINREEVRQALKRANVLSFVDSLPDGIDTMVGDRGVRLSGGQRQRIGIARALYTSPDILILDEATSALDNETEKAVMEAIDRLQGEITMIIIAHRLSTIKNCDIVLEVKGGKVFNKKVEEI